LDRWGFLGPDHPNAGADEHGQAFQDCVDDLGLKTIVAQNLDQFAVIPIAAKVVILNGYALDPCPVRGIQASQDFVLAALAVDLQEVNRCNAQLVDDAREQLLLHHNRFRRRCLRGVPQRQLQQPACESPNPRLGVEPRRVNGSAMRERLPAGMTHELQGTVLAAGGSGNDDHVV